MQVAYRGHTIQIDDKVAEAVEKYLFFSVRDTTELDSSVAVKFHVSTEKEVEQTVRTHTTQELEEKINAELTHQLDCFAGNRWR